jgi:hypothetical protein
MISVLEKYFNNSKRNSEELKIEEHEAKSQKEILQVIDSHLAVFHCYSSDLLMLNKVLDMGFFVSFTANITFPKVNMDEVIFNVPMDKLLLETDSPYMTPPPNRGKRNVPQTVKIVAEKISKVKNISIEEVIKMTNANAKKLFGLSLCLVLFIFGSALFGTNELYAQTNINYDYYYDDDDYYDDYDPYVRRLGFGPLFGGNTFVDRYTTGAKSFSYEGIFAVGGLINYRVFDNVIVQSAYTYGKNMHFVNRLADTNKDWLDPSYHQAVELSVIGMFNSKQMVNFYGSAGVTYFMNKISRNLWTYDNPVNEKIYFDDNKLGMNAGVGIFINIALGNAGTLVVNGEWKLNFRLDAINLDYDPRLSRDNSDHNKPTQHTSMSSMPRGGLIWYIPFLK